MKVYLLTHERELVKKSNTGRLVKEVLGEQAEVVVWKRKEPDPALVALIEAGKALMLYPDKGEQESIPLARIGEFEYFVILDSTWQEARKMYNKSPYLQDAQKIDLKPDRPSEYNLRRNQIEGGLSTAECAITLLNVLGEASTSARLDLAFQCFNQK